jgi:hypothetical protein
MQKNGTGGIQHNLKSGGANALTVTAGNGYTWQLNDLPDRAPTGPLALYLTCLLLTISGTITQAGGTGVAIPRDRLPALLIDSVDWTNSWMGPVLQKANVNGARMPIVEFVAGGFSYGQRQQNRIPAANGTYSFSMTIRVPALNDRRGRLIKETSNLAVLFQPSQIRVNMQPLSTLTTYSPAASWGTLTQTITAQLDPRQELVLGVPMEWILHTPTSGGPQVTIEGFGRQAGVTGVETKGGVAFLADLSLKNALGGVVTPNVCTDFQFQWRGQGTTYDVKAWLQQYIDLLPNDRPQQSAAVNQGTAGTDDFSGFPYIQDNTGSQSTTIDLDELLFFPLVIGGDDLELTNLQTADSDQTFNLTQTGGFAGGNHQILAQYARVWTDGKMADWLSQVLKGGDSSLAALVLQGRKGVSDALARAKSAPNGRLGQRIPQSKHVVTADQFTYLPYQLV